MELDAILMRNCNELDEQVLEMGKSSSSDDCPTVSWRMSRFRSMSISKTSTGRKGYQGSFATLAVFLKRCLNAGMPKKQYDQLLEALVDMNKVGRKAQIDLQSDHFGDTDREMASGFLSTLGIGTNWVTGKKKKVTAAHSPVTQEDMLQRFRERIMEDGQLMSKTQPAMIRPAKLGEHVVTRVAGRVIAETEVSDETSWVVKAPTSHQEEYVLSQPKFEANWCSDEAGEIDQSTPQRKKLAEIGFKQYWPKPGILKWMYKLNKEDLDLLPSRDFKSSFGAIQAMRVGDHLVMPYPKSNANEIYLMPGDTVVSCYSQVEKEGIEEKQRKDQAALLRPLAFDWRTRGDAKADTELLMIGFAEPFNLLYRYQIQADVMETWIGGIAKQYQENPYHDWKHAFDVFQFTYGGLIDGEASKYFHFQDILVLLLAAIAHDVGHFGLTNAFLINTESDLAIEYNDKSPLESMHTSVFFKTLQKPGHNFLDSMSMENFKMFRGKVIDAILATDMSHHFELVDKFSVRVSAAKADTPFVMGNDVLDRDACDNRLLLQAFMHMADIGHCARPFAIHQHLVVQLEKEFFNQGDKERELELPVMPLMDRTRDSAAAGQGFFLTKLVQPLLEPYTYFLTPERGGMLKGNLQDNVTRWAALVKKHGSKTALEIVNAEIEEEEEAAKRPPQQVHFEEELLEAGEPIPW